MQKGMLAVSSLHVVRIAHIIAHELLRLHGL